MLWFILGDTSNELQQRFFVPNKVNFLENKDTSSYRHDKNLVN